MLYILPETTFRKHLEVKHILQIFPNKFCESLPRFKFFDDIRMKTKETLQGRMIENQGTRRG